ncbi:MAG: protein kinase [Candidatus Aminicenantes bacterium]|nr:protein kinase [Candidatus Aminicenantes bacterium]
MSVKCPKCQTENSDSQSFCGSCGTRLPETEKIAVPTRTLEFPREKLTTGSTFARRYQIIEELGKGGMGKVYKANDIEIKEKIAIKLIKPEISTDKKIIERFQNELRFARKIRHKNVCQMYDLNSEDGTYYITMEYIEGENLRDMIRMSGRLGIGTAFSIARQICEGLAEAHKLGVIHRDLKPSNIMIDKEGRVRIMDFGIARSLKEKSITGVGVIMGTPEYMSPEQVEGKDSDRSSDIYSLGTILYEMVTGRAPFGGDTALAVAMKHKTEMPKDPRESNTQLSEELSSVILKCLEKDKDKRYQSAEELRSVLVNIEKDIPATERTDAHKKPLTSKEITVTLSVKRLWIPASIVMLMIVVGLFLWHPWSGFKSSSLKSGKPSVAVLPFEDLSSGKDQDYLCFGFAESLINALSKINRLRVPARTSSFSFLGKDQTIRDIGDKLDVRTLLVGSLQKAGKRIRITTQLIDTADESLLWSEQYNRDLDDVFDIQDEISLHIVETLKVKLIGKERAALTKRETINTEAYQLYLQGRFFRWKEDKDNFFKAKDCFEQAIEKDPEYSSAYAGLADTYMLLGLFSLISRDEAAKQAKEAVQKALDLDANSSEAHTSMGVILEIFDWDWKGAEREFKRALDLNPNHFDAHYEYALLLSRTKRFDEAEVEFKKSLRIDPLQYMAYDKFSVLYKRIGDIDKAEEQSKKRDALQPPFSSGADAVERTKRLIERDGRLSDHLRLLAEAHIQSGEETEAFKIIGELEAAYKSSDIGNIAFNTAVVYLYLNETDKAVLWLERSYEKRDPLLCTWMVNSTDPDPLRQDSRFTAILTKMGLN